VLKRSIIAALLVAALPVTASAATVTGSWGQKGKSSFEKSFEGFGKSSYGSGDRWDDDKDTKKHASLDFGKGKGDSFKNDFKNDAKHGGKDWSDKVHGGKLPTDLADATFGHGSKGSWKGWGKGKGWTHVPRDPDCIPAPVPLPAGFGLLALGIGALGVAKRRRKAA
jgi:hypothetical protein